MKTLLVTGGCGYIGSHAVVELLKEGYYVVVYDNLSNSKLDVLNFIFEITGVRVSFVKGDIQDAGKLDETFNQYDFDAVIHFAGLKAVGESMCRPLLYYNNNVCGSMQLLNAMARNGVKRMIYSSSATIYGNNVELPLSENSLTSMPSSPYGASKFFVEKMLADLCRSERDWQIIVLRYFNPVGAHDSGLLGERPRGMPNNLMPSIIQSANGELDYLSVFGNDYDTSDGTCIRDYIHVVDLVKGHISALMHCDKSNGITTVNLGTGNGYSVMQVIKTFEAVNMVDVPYKIVNRRLGDVPASYADVTYAKKFMGWSAELGLEEMCRSSWACNLKDK